MLLGEKTGLRAIDRADLPQLLEWRNREAYRRYFREFREISPAMQAQWFERTVMGDPGTVMFAVVERESGRLLGAAGLCYINWTNRNADFSLYIGADNLYIDPVFAPDAARTMIRYAFDELGLHRLWSEIYAYDEAKQILFRDLGFSLDGRHRETVWSNGQWHDSLFYSLLESDPRTSGPHSS
jgi:RimJ/RimL family protein N-acetyltransferase